MMHSGSCDLSPGAAPNQLKKGFIMFPTRPFLIPMCFLAFVFVGSMTVLAQNDNQAWLAGRKSLLKKDNLGIDFYFEIRVREDARQAYGYFFGPTIAYKVKPWLRVGGAFRVIHIKRGDQGFAKIRRPEFVFTFSQKLTGRLHFALRNRYEYFSREGRDDTDRLRSRITFSSPLRRGALTGLYFSNEFFYVAETGFWERNRVIPIGFNFKVGRKQKLKLFYMIEHLRRGSRDFHSLGVFYSF